jgi:hypothetical protein
VVVDTYPDVLHRGLIVNLVDQQNVNFAQKVFSKEVEECMDIEGFPATATFVHRVRKWFEACDKRGVPVMERVESLVDMQNYLCNTYAFDYDDYPPPSNYVLNIPIITFEGILCNCSGRILLYLLSSNGTFNHRAISTLAVENAFSTLSDMCPTGRPTGPSIPKLIRDMCELDYFKMKPDK